MAIRKVMRLPGILAATGWAKPTLYMKIKEGKFPKGIRLDPEARAVVWFEDEVQAFINSKASNASASQDAPTAPSDPLVKAAERTASALERIALSLSNIDARLHLVSGTFKGQTGKYAGFIRISDLGE